MSVDVGEQRCQMATTVIAVWGDRIIRIGAIAGAVVAVLELGRLLWPDPTPRLVGEIADVSIVQENDPRGVRRTAEAQPWFTPGVLEDISNLEEPSSISEWVAFEAFTVPAGPHGGNRTFVVLDESLPMVVQGRTGIARPRPRRDRMTAFPNTTLGACTK
jgi:hypothetical protein